MSPRSSIPHRRERILQAAEDLVLERSFGAMTMQALADRVGIGKGSLYLEFGGKDDVLEALLASSTERVLNAVRRACHGPEIPSLSQGYRAAAVALLSEPLLCAAFLDDGGVLGEQVTRTRHERYRQRHQWVEQWIRNLQDAGRLRRDLTPEGLALALSSATLGLLTAAGTLGSVDRDALLGALTALETMTAGLESDGSHP